MNVLFACGLGLFASVQDPLLPREMALEEPRRLRTQETPQDRPREPVRPAPSGRPFIDLDWLEVTPAVGMAVFSDKFLADPAPCLAIRAHAPMPWLNPAGDPDGEYFGLFAQIELATIDRELSPSVSHRSGVISFLSLGVDYSFVRDGSWIVMARAGVMYAYYGGVADLQNGIGPLVGATLGYQLSGKLAVTYTPELLFGDTGSWVFMNTVGLLIHF
jgi:hypothetical protein